MKKLFFIFVFILISINLLANMDSSPQAMESSHSHHHHKPYMKKFHEDKNLSQDQKNEIMLLRMDFMNEERSLNKSLKKLRRDMNHCMRSDENGKDKEYEELKLERERLRREKGNLIRDYKDAVSEVLKKQ